MQANTISPKNLFIRAVEINQRYFPGICLALTISIASMFLSVHYGIPDMLMALLLGLTFNFLTKGSQCLPGIKFCSKYLLQWGVALLGLRITFGDIVSLGGTSLLVVCISVLLTIGFGALMARVLGYDRNFGILTGGSVAICGTSAALAISSMLPQNEQARQNTLVTIIGVTTLSTLVMIFYPMLADVLAMTPKEAGLFLGGSIHNVAQVVGAGYSMSSETGDLSVLVKLFRVAMLVPVVLLIGLTLAKGKGKKDPSSKSQRVSIPRFLIAFILICITNSLGLIPKQLVHTLSDSSSWLLLTAVAALGALTSLKDIIKIGWPPVILLVSETLFLATLFIVYILLSR